MSTAERGVLFANLRKPIDLRLARDLNRTGVRVTVSSIGLAYNECKILKPTALLYFSSSDEKDVEFDPELRRITRDFRKTIVYVISSNMTQRLSLLADDHVEAVFPRAPTADRLLTIIDRASALRIKDRERATPRYPVQFKCMIKVVGVPGLVEGEVSQLGRGGFMAKLPQSPNVVPPGDQVRFSIMPPESSVDLKIEGDGDIRWGLPTSDGGVQFGVKFTKLPSPSEEKLLQYINKLRITVPMQSTLTR